MKLLPGRTVGSVEIVERCPVCINVTNSSWQILLKKLEYLQMTLDFIYRVFCKMLSMIPRICVKSMHRIHIYSLILIFVIDVVYLLQSSIDAHIKSWILYVRISNKKKFIVYLLHVYTL
jgi:hypothetical protein